MNQKNQARLDMRHALDALGDGSGWVVWGPGIVGEALQQKNKTAARAFDAASVTVFVQGLAPQRDGLVEAERFIHCMRHLAPAILELMLEMEPEND